MKPLNLAQDAPWKQRYRATKFTSAQSASHHPSRGLVVSNESGGYQLYAWDVPTGALRQLTRRRGGVSFGGLSPDGRFVYYFEEMPGTELGHYVRLPYDAAQPQPQPQPQDITPQMPPYATFSLSQSLNGSMLSFTAAHAGDFDIYTLPVRAEGSLGQPELLYSSDYLTFGALLSYDGDYAVIATTEHKRTYDFSLLGVSHIQSPPGQRQMMLMEEEDGSIRPIAFAPLPGDTRLLCVTDVYGYERPMVWDLKSGDRIDFPLYDLEGDITPWGWSPDGSKLLLNHLHRAQHQLYAFDVERSTLNLLEHPDGTYESGYFAPDGDEIIVTMQDATLPTRVVALDAQSGALRRRLLAAADVSAGQQWRSVMFPSSGNVQVQAWVATPEGEGPFPTLIHIHGGPTAVQTNSYKPLAQAFLDHGFAFMSVNYRGSTTFGRDFENAIRGILGHREVDDLAAAQRWLLENDIAKADSILLTGASYGGYLTLQALGRRPDLWAGGMAQVAIADWALVYEDQPAALRDYQRAMFGGTPEERPEQTRASSPITYAEAIAAPVLVIQGRDDPRCPARQMQAYEARLKAAGKDIEIHWFEGGQDATAQNIDHAEIMLRFAYRVLKS